MQRAGISPARRRWRATTPSADSSRSAPGLCETIAGRARRDDAFFLRLLCRFLARLRGTAERLLVDAPRLVGTLARRLRGLRRLFGGLLCRFQLPFGVARQRLQPLRVGDRLLKLPF